MNFWLTVRTGISGPELVFGSHSSRHVMSEFVLLFPNSMDSTPADKVLKKTPLDLQKLFPIYHVCPKCLAVHVCRSAFQKNGSAKNWIRWERHRLTGNVGMSTAY